MQKPSAAVTPFLIGALITLPIFFVATGSGLRLAPRWSGETVSLTVLPVSLLFAALCVPILLLTSPRTSGLKVERADNLLLAFVLLTTLSFLAGLFFNPMPSPQAPLHSFLTYLQALAPITGFFIARLLLSPGRGLHTSVTCPSVKGLGSFYLGMASTTSTFLFLYTIQTVLDGGSVFRFSGITDHIGPFVNFKMKRFFPILLAVTGTVLLSIVLYGRTRFIFRCIACITYGGVAVSVALMWSRTALLILLLGNCILLALPFLRGGARLRMAALTYLAVATPLVAVIVPWSLSHSDAPLALGRVLGTAAAIGSDAELEESLRFERMREGAVQGLGMPLGDIYRMHSRGSGFRVLDTDNGWLDIAVRAGPFGLISVLALALICALKAIRVTMEAGTGPSVAQHYYWVYAAHTSCLVSAVLFGNIWINLATEPYFGVMFWFMLGATAQINWPAKGEGILV